MHVIENRRHIFNWDDTQVLDKKQSRNKRIISEMLNINNNSEAINEKEDTHFFNRIYKTVLNV